MPSKLPIGYIDIRVFAHATEDVDKVLAAVHNVLPSEAGEVVVFERNALTGHHGNPITLIEARITDRRIAQAVFEKLCSGLGVLDKELLGREIEEHLERGNLYVRLDKQSAYLNVLKLSSVDPIHMRLHFRVSDEEVIDFCKKSGLLL